MLILYEITESGTGYAPIDQQNKVIQDALTKTREHYQRFGFKRPWISFLAFEKGEYAGVCGFKAAPAGGKVEITYEPFPKKDDEVIAADMIRKLTEIANFRDRTADVTIHISPEEDSTGFLKNLGFSNYGLVDT